MKLGNTKGWPRVTCLNTLLGYPSVKKTKGRKIKGKKKMEIGKYERLTLSHLLKYFAGVPYCKKERREGGKGREKMKF